MTQLTSKGIESMECLTGLSPMGVETIVRTEDFFAYKGRLMRDYAAVPTEDKTISEETLEANLEALKNASELHRMVLGAYLAKVRACEGIARRNKYKEDCLSEN